MAETVDQAAGDTGGEGRSHSDLPRAGASGLQDRREGGGTELISADVLLRDWYNFRAMC